MVKIFPEWVTGPEQGKSSGRIATFSHDPYPFVYCPA